MLNRDGIQRLSLIHTQAYLATVFGISIPTLRAYIRGREPREAITIYINKKIQFMLRARDVA